MENLGQNVFCLSDVLYFLFFQFVTKHTFDVIGVITRVTRVIVRQQSRVAQLSQHAGRVWAGHRSHRVGAWGHGVGGQPAGAAPASGEAAAGTQHVAHQRGRLPHHHPHPPRRHHCRCHQQLPPERHGRRPVFPGAGQLRGHGQVLALLLRRVLAPCLPLRHRGPAHLRAAHELRAEGRGSLARERGEHVAGECRECVAGEHVARECREQVGAPGYGPDPSHHPGGGGGWRGGGPPAAGQWATGERRPPHPRRCAPLLPPPRTSPPHPAATPTFLHPPGTVSGCRCLAVHWRS